MLNMNIDTATDLGFDEDGSSADRERYRDSTLYISALSWSVKNAIFCIEKKYEKKKVHNVVLLKHNKCDFFLSLSFCFENVLKYP